jgi:homoserine dehydrogenase
LKVQIVGFGNIGKGLAEVIISKRKVLREKHGLDLKVVSVSDITGTVFSDNGLDLEKILNTVKKKGNVIGCPGARPITGIEAIEEIDSDVVIEATPTNIKTGEPGLSHMLKSFDLGKHVVTSNKGPLVLKFKKLKEAAEKKKVKFMFEASVGGAMPVINLARDCLSGDEIQAIVGILNGTTNYILTRMHKEHSPFETVLREAQELGIAEADPSYDVEGIDTASKLVILANALMGLNATYKDVKIQGIKKITLEAVELSKEAGYVIKLIGEVRDGRLEVSPRLVPVNHPLNVDGALNVAMLEADIAGEVIIVGKGAGATETSSAILSDLIAIWNQRTI